MSAEDLGTAEQSAPTHAERAEYEAAERAHYEAIAAAHPDFVEMSKELIFAIFVGQVEDGNRIVDSGSFDEIVSLFGAYKDYCAAIRARHPQFVKLWQERGFDEYVRADATRMVAFHAGSADEQCDLLDSYMKERAVLGWNLENAREERALRALIDAPVSREQLDRVAGSSNSPDIVLGLRKALSLDIPCKLVTVRDRDGKVCRPGIYNLSDRDRPKVLACLERLEHRRREVASTPPAVEKSESAADRAWRLCELALLSRRAAWGAATLKAFGGSEGNNDAEKGDQ